MSFTGREDLRAGTVDDAAFVAGKNIQQTFAGYFVGRIGRAGQVEERTVQINEAHQVVRAPAAADGSSPADRERDMDPVFVRIGFRPREGHAVVGRYDN